MARGEIFNARIERIAAGGAGIAKFQGKSVFIALTAPGDCVRCRIAKDHKSWAEAELLEILESSPQRAVPECPLYGRCGGCSLQHLGYEAQVEAKTAILRDAFLRIGGIAPPEIKVRRSAPYGYRNRMQFHRIEGGRVGLMERKSARPIALADCPVADAGIREALKAGNFAPQLAPKPAQPGGKERFCVYSKGGVFLCEGGNARGRISILDRELAVDAGVFFQSNAAMLEPLIEDLIKAASAADMSLPLADIYCGVGTFASFLSGRFRPEKRGFPEIDLVEENRAALALARENMPPGAKANCCARSDTAWVNALGGANCETKRNWGFMVLDPPREGLSGPLRNFLAKSGPDLAAYVSCDPATLARDSRALAEGGYTLKELGLYDFYPQTAHIESLAIFCRERKSEN